MAASKRLKQEIVKALLLSHNNNCLSVVDLHDEVKKNVKCSREDLSEALEEERKDGGVEREDENQYCLKKKRERKSVPLPDILKRIVPIPQQKVAVALSQATEPVTTGELAKKLDLNTRQVYAICRQFEKKGYVTSQVKKGEKSVFFAPIIGEVVHAGNFERVDSLYKKLDGIMGEFSPGDPKTDLSLQSFFTGMLKKKEYAQHRKSINSFRKSLLRTVSRADEKRDVDEALGLRPFHPKVRTWESSVG